MPCPFYDQPIALLERQFQSHLPDAGIAGISNLAEVTAIDVTARIRKLSVVEDIE